MRWVKLDTDYGENPKIQQLAREWGSDEARAFWPMLLGFVAEHMEGKSCRVKIEAHGKLSINYLALRLHSRADVCLKRLQRAAELRLIVFRKIDSEEPVKPGPPDREATYFIRSGDHVKIGVSANVTARLAALQTGTPNRLELLLTLPGNHERKLHRMFQTLAANGEWFRYEGALKSYIVAPTERPKFSVGETEVGQNWEIFIPNMLKRFSVTQDGLQDGQKTDDKNEGVEERNKRLEKEKIEKEKEVWRETSFAVRWEKYPNKEGKKEAFRSFCGSVASDDDLKLMDTALDNYIAHVQHERGRGFNLAYKQGKTWFGNWRDEKWQKPPELDFGGSNGQPARNGNSNSGTATPTGERRDGYPRYKPKQ